MNFIVILIAPLSPQSNEQKKEIVFFFRYSILKAE